jgi:rhomboid protease GluP
MASRVCPYCQRLNGEAETHCYNCGRRLPGPLAKATKNLVRDVLGAEAPMTKLIVGMELVVFAMCLAVDGFQGGILGGFRGSTLIRFGALFGPLVPSEPWRLLSAMFVHGGVLHLAMNMMTFASFGAPLERELGSARATILFLLSGVLGFVGTLVWKGGYAFSVGASGGIFGQMGAVVGLLYARRDPNWKKALTRGLLFAFLITLAIPRIDTAAHLGGFISGIGLGFAFHKEQMMLRLNRTAQVLAALAVALCVASVVLSSLSPVSRAIRAQEMLDE